MPSRHGGRSACGGLGPCGILLPIVQADARGGQQLIENPGLIFDAVQPLSGKYIVYPNAKEDLERLMQTVHDAKKKPPRPTCQSGPSISGQACSSRF